MDLISHHRDGRVLVLEINRPSKKNALTLPMFASLAGALRDADADDSVHAIVLCGAGDNFCAGHDLDEFEQWPQEAHDPVPRFLHTLAAVAKPLVIAVQGWGVGIGATALLHADWVVASGEARLRYPFVNLGIAPEAGCTVLLAQHIGALRAKQLLLSGEAIDANAALSWGLVSELCAADTLRTVALHRAQALAEKPPGAVQGIKTLLSTADKLLHDQIDREVRAINESVMARRGDLQPFKKSL